MLRVAGRIAQYHDLELIIVACLVCIVATNASARPLTSHRDGVDPQQRIQLGAAVVAFSVGVWATHFISILAYHSSVPFSFDVPLCVLSLALAIGATTLAFGPDLVLDGVR